MLEVTEDSMAITKSTAALLLIPGAKAISMEELEDRTPPYAGAGL